MGGNRKSEQEKIIFVNGKKIVGCLSRDGIAAVECSSMGAGSMGGENCCGNLLW